MVVVHECEHERIKLSLPARELRTRIYRDGDRIVTDSEFTLTREQARKLADELHREATTLKG